MIEFSRAYTKDKQAYRIFHRLNALIVLCICFSSSIKIEKSFRKLFKNTPGFYGCRGVTHGGDCAHREHDQKMKEMHHTDFQRS